MSGLEFYRDRAGKLFIPDGHVLAGEERQAHGTITGPA